MNVGPEEHVMVHDFEPDVATMREDVLRGLRCEPKKLPSQYLYDERGARLFQRICETSEYYLTRTEVSIFETNIDAVSARIGPGALIIEPGSGNGLKTRLLLNGLKDPAGYVPIDLSKKQLGRFAKEIEDEFPDLEVLPVCADFTGDYEVPAATAEVRSRVTYFPGSTIGNFAPREAVAVLRHLATLGRSMLIGIDLDKDRSILEPAYDDAEGHSREFALNLLVRLNRELGADFAVEQFGYEAPYNEDAGRIEMSLVSERKQTVHIDRHRVEFQRDERMLTEYSYKFDLDGFAELAGKAGLLVAETWTDPDDLFGVLYLTSSPT
jgi:dimethylhistidine N-methyltransferase